MVACIRRPQNDDDYGRKAHPKTHKNKIITKHKTNDKKCAKENQSCEPPAPSLPRPVSARPRAIEIQNDFVRNKSMMMVQGRLQSAIDDSRRGGASCKNCTRFVNLFLFLSVYFVLQLTSSFAKCCGVFLLVFFFPSSLHVIHSVFLHSFLSFFLCRYVLLLLLLVIFLSFFLILWQLSGTYAIVGSPLSYFRRFFLFCETEDTNRGSARGFVFFLFCVAT